MSRLLSTVHAVLRCLDTAGTPWSPGPLDGMAPVTVSFRMVRADLHPFPAGGSDEGYCKWMCAAAHGRGWRPVVMNFRGCNGLELTSPKVRADPPHRPAGVCREWCVS